MTNSEWERQTQIKICKEVIAQFRQTSLETGYHIEDISSIYTAYMVYNDQIRELDAHLDYTPTVMYKKLNELNRTFQEFLMHKWPPTMINRIVETTGVKYHFPRDLQ